MIRNSGTCSNGIYSSSISASEEKYEWGALWQWEQIVNSTELEALIHTELESVISFRFCKGLVSCHLVN